METLWKILGFMTSFLFLELCNGLPINLENSERDPSAQLLTGLVGVLLAVCSVVLLVGCLCCQRKNGFKEFRDSPVVASVASNLDHGHVNPISGSEFTIFTPISPPHHNNNVFLANQRIVSRSQEDYKYGDIDVSSWFDGTEKDFPRTRLKYIRELGKGWFGRVVEGTAQGLIDSTKDSEWTPVVVRILEASATSRDRVLFLYDATIYRCGFHANILQIFGRSLDTVPLLLLQEYCAPGDMKRYLRNIKMESERFLLSDLPLLWSYQLTMALKFLHERKVTHPDLAARNCQLTNDLNLKLGDYGLSATFYPEDYYQGSPGVPLRWCAPETISYTSTTIQSKPMTIEANIWSLGITLWEIFECGEQPYSKLSDDEVISQVLGSPKVRLLRPKCNLIYIDYIYRLMQSCWLTSESRPIISQIDMMLADLMQVYEHMKNTDQIESTTTIQDFDKRWESLKPNTVVKEDCDVLSNKKLSASLNNLHGSLDNLLEKQLDPMESWLENVATDTGDMSYVHGLSQAIKDLDNAIALENVSSDSSHQPSPVPETILKHKLQFKLGQIGNVFKTKYSDIGNDTMQDSILYVNRTSSESETEDETWKKKIERGAYSEKVRQKSQSVADLMILTHIDCSESDSETLPSLDYKVNCNGKLRYFKDNASLKFGSEGNLINVKETFQDDLRKLQEERKDSLLFVPDKFSQSSFSNVSRINSDLPCVESTSPVKKLIEELNNPIEMVPPQQVYNVFNVSVNQKYSPVRITSNDVRNVKCENQINLSVCDVMNSNITKIEDKTAKDQDSQIFATAFKQCNDEYLILSNEFENQLNDLEISEEQPFLDKQSGKKVIHQQEENSILNNESYDKNEEEKCVINDDVLLTNNYIKEIEHLESDKNIYTEKLLHKKQLLIDEQTQTSDKEKTNEENKKNLILKTFPSDQIICTNLRNDVPKLSDIIQSNIELSNYIITNESNFDEMSESLNLKENCKMYNSKQNLNVIIDKDSGLNTPENSASLEKLDEDEEETNETQNFDMYNLKMYKNRPERNLRNDDNEDASYNLSFDSDKSNLMVSDENKDGCKSTDEKIEDVKVFVTKSIFNVEENEHPTPEMKHFKEFVDITNCDSNFSPLEHHNLVNVETEYVVLEHNVDLEKDTMELKHDKSIEIDGPSLTYYDRSMQNIEDTHKVKETNTTDLVENMVIKDKRHLVTYCENIQNNVLKLEHNEELLENILLENIDEKDNIKPNLKTENCVQNQKNEFQINEVLKANNSINVSEKCDTNLQTKDVIITTDHPNLVSNDISNYLFIHEEIVPLNELDKENDVNNKNRDLDNEIKNSNEIVIQNDVIDDKLDGISTNCDKLNAAQNINENQNKSAGMCLDVREFLDNEIKLSCEILTLNENVRYEATQNENVDSKREADAIDCDKMNPMQYFNEEKCQNESEYSTSLNVIQEFIDNDIKYSNETLTQNKIDNFECEETAAVKLNKSVNFSEGFSENLNENSSIRQSEIAYNTHVVDFDKSKPAQNFNEDECRKESIDFDVSINLVQEFLDNAIKNSNEILTQNEMVKSQCEAAATECDQTETTQNFTEEKCHNEAVEFDNSVNLSQQFSENVYNKDEVFTTDFDKMKLTQSVNEEKCQNKSVDIAVSLNLVQEFLVNEIKNSNEILIQNEIIKFECEAIAAECEMKTTQNSAEEKYDIEAIKFENSVNLSKEFSENLNENSIVTQEQIVYNKHEAFTTDCDKMKPTQNVTEEKYQYKSIDIAVSLDLVKEFLDNEIKNSNEILPQNEIAKFECDQLKTTQNSTEEKCHNEAEFDNSVNLSQEFSENVYNKGEVTEKCQNKSVDFAVSSNLVQEFLDNEIKNSNEILTQNEIIKFECEAIAAECDQMKTTQNSAEEKCYNEAVNFDNSVILSEEFSITQEEIVYKKHEAFTTDCDKMKPTTNFNEEKCQNEMLDVVAPLNLVQQFLDNEIKNSNDVLTQNEIIKFECEATATECDQMKASLNFMEEKHHQFPENINKNSIIRQNEIVDGKLETIITNCDKMKLINLVREFLDNEIKNSSETLTQNKIVNKLESNATECDQLKSTQNFSEEKHNEKTVNFEESVNLQDFPKNVNKNSFVTKIDGEFEENTNCVKIKHAENKLIDISMPLIFVQEFLDSEKHSNNILTQNETVNKLELSTIECERMKMQHFIEEICRNEAVDFNRTVNLQETVDNQHQLIATDCDIKAQKINENKYQNMENEVTSSNEILTQNKIINTKLKGNTTECNNMSVQHFGEDLFFNINFLTTELMPNKSATTLSNNLISDIEHSINISNENSYNKQILQTESSKSEHFSKDEQCHIEQNINILPVKIDDSLIMEEKDLNGDQQYLFEINYLNQVTDLDNETQRKFTNEAAISNDFKECSIKKELDTMQAFINYEVENYDCCSMNAGKQTNTNLLEKLDVNEDLDKIKECLFNESHLKKTKEFVCYEIDHYNDCFFTAENYVVCNQNKQNMDLMSDGNVVKQEFNKVTGNILKNEVFNFDNLKNNSVNENIVNKSICEKKLQSNLFLEDKQIKERLNMKRITNEFLNKEIQNYEECPLKNNFVESLSDCNEEKIYELIACELTSDSINQSKNILNNEIEEISTNDNNEESFSVTDKYSFENNTKVINKNDLSGLLQTTIDFLSNELLNYEDYKPINKSEQHESNINNFEVIKTECETFSSKTSAINSCLEMTKQFLINEITNYEDDIKNKPVMFDLSETQEEIAPNSLTHFTTFTSSTPFIKRSVESNVILGASDDYSINFYSGLKTSVDEAEDMKFSSNFVQDFEKTNVAQKLFDAKPTKSDHSDLYSLETWDNFLRKSFDDQDNRMDFSNFNEEPHSLLFIDNYNDLDKSNDKPVYLEDDDFVNEECDKKLSDDGGDKHNNGNFKITQILNETYDPNSRDKTYNMNETLMIANETFTKPNQNFEDNTFVKIDVASEKTKDKQNASWETGGGWFLHPQSTTEEPTGQMVISQESGTDSYVGFNMDDEIMAAIRNELLTKLPHAQRASSEPVEDNEELDSSEKNEVFLRYNVYNTPLSPIPEESYIETDESGHVTPRDESEDDNSSDWSVQDNNSLNVYTETPSPQLLDSPGKSHVHPHTPSQDSCCSNDTLFNLEELNPNEHEKPSDVTKVIYDIEMKETSIEETEYESEKSLIDNSSISILCKPTEDPIEKALTEQIEDMPTKEVLQVPKININNFITEFLNNERYHELNNSVELTDLQSEEIEEVSTTSDIYLTVSDNTFSFGQNVAPLNSPEDRPWKELQASFRSCEEDDETLDDSQKFSDCDENQKGSNCEELCEELEENEENTVIKNNCESEDDVQIENTDETMGYEDVNNDDLYENDLVYENLTAKNVNINKDLDYVNVENENCSELVCEDDLIAKVEDEEKFDRFEDMYGPLADIRFSGPCSIQLMTTSFSESNDLGDEQDWDSGSDTRSSSSGEFIWREGEHEASVKALRAAPQSENVEDVLPMENIQEENESSCSSSSDGEGDCPEFVPSAWDKYATPTKSSLRSPEKTLEQKREKKPKGVWFKKQKYHCVYEYPREPDSPVLQSYDLWKPTPDFATLADWDLDTDTFVPTLDESDTILQETQIKSDKLPHNLYHLTAFTDINTAPTMLDDDFFISGSSKPFDMLGSLTSQFFPGKQFTENWNENVTPDSGVEDITPGSLIDNNEYMPTSNVVQSLKNLAAAVAKRSGNKNIELGGLRHTRNKLKLDLPPSPSAFTSSRSFNVEPTEEIINRQIPTFTTFGKSRFLVQHVDTPPDDESTKNVSFEALPYKPAKQFVKEDFDKERHKIEIVRGEASLLDSADEDSGIESCTLERKKGVEG